jgi:hypothetical protein
MPPLCPVCEEPMKEHGRAFQCEPCRQTIIFFAVSDASPYIAAGRVLPSSKHDQRGALDRAGHDGLASTVPTR